MDEKIEITKKEYLRLLIAEETLNRLEHGGVDNWEWYSESLNPEGEERLDEFEAKTKKALNF